MDGGSTWSLPALIDPVIVTLKNPHATEIDTEPGSTPCSNVRPGVASGIGIGPASGLGSQPRSPASISTSLEVHRMKSPSPDHSRDVWLVGVDGWFGFWCGVGWLIGVCRGSGGAGGLVRGA